MKNENRMKNEKIKRRTQQTPSMWHLPPNHVHLRGGSTVSSPHHSVPQWLSTVFPTSSLPPAMAREQRSVGGHPGNHNTARRCFMSAQERWTGPSAIMHPSRCSPFHRPCRCTQYVHERLLLIAFIGTFCNPSHFLDV